MSSPEPGAPRLDIPTLGYGAANVGNLFRPLSGDEAWAVLSVGSAPFCRPSLARSTCCRPRPGGCCGRARIMPAASTLEGVAAIRSVLPLYDAPGIDLMASADGVVFGVQHALLTAAGTALDTTRFVERFAYYEVAKSAYLIVRTGASRNCATHCCARRTVGHASA